MKLIKNVNNKTSFLKGRGIYMLMLELYYVIIQDYTTPFGYLVKRSKRVCFSESFISFMETLHKGK